MTENVVETAMYDAVSAVMEEVDAYVIRGVIGAWRAGYDVLDVYLHNDSHPQPLRADEFSIGVGLRCIPRHQPNTGVPAYAGSITARRIDLREIDPAVIDELRAEVLR